MRITPGKCTDRGGYALLVVLLVVATVAATASAILPKRLSSIASDRGSEERRALARIEEGLNQSIQTELAIPGPATWAQAVAKSTGLSKKAVEYADPRFQSDPGSARLFLIDPGLISNLLPYKQGNAGLSGSDTNLLGPNARIILLSTSRRGQSLPVTENDLTQDQFDALWDWVPNPATLAPPSGWPDEWLRQAQSIHVVRIPIRRFFARVEMKNLAVGIGSPLHPGGNLKLDSLLQSQTSLSLLKGSMIRVSKVSLLGLPVGSPITLVVQRDELLDFEDERSGPVPLAYFPFRSASTSISVITNEGSLGAAWNGRCTEDASTGGTGPRSPAFSGFSTSNRCLDLSDSSGYVPTSGTLPKDLPKFTLAGWIYPTSISGDRSIAFGFPNLLHLGIFQYSGRYYLHARSRRGGSIYASYPYSLKTWHHLALVGDGRYLRLYIDGQQVSYRRRFITNYGRRTATTFQLGCEDGYWIERYRGYLDEVLLLDVALTDSQIQTLATGAIQNVLNVPNGS